MRDSWNRGLRRALSFSGLIALTVLLFACSGVDSTETPDSEADALRSYLEGTGPLPSAGVREQLRLTFARLAVRGSGLRSAGVLPDTEEAWSPVAERAGVTLLPADVRSWQAAGDIDSRGAFVPLEVACARTGTLDTGALPGEVTGPKLPQKLLRLACSLDRLAESEVSVDWAPRSSHAVILDEEHRNAMVNPRLLALIETGELAAPNGALGPDGPVSGAPLPNASGSASPAGDSPGAQPLDIDDNGHHPPPPKTTTSSDSSRTWCDKACDDVWNNVFPSCDCNGTPGSGGGAGGAGGSGGSGGSGGLGPNRSSCDCSKGAGNSTSGCGSSACKCAHASRSAQDLTGTGVSFLLFGALVLRRRKSFRIPGKSLVSLLVGIVLLVWATHAMAAPTPRLVDVKLTVTPAEATVFVDGNAVAPQNGILRVPAGSHTFSAKLEGYSDASQNIDVPEKGTGTLVTLRLTADKGYLVITGSDSAAVLSVDGKEVGKGAFSGLVAPGNHILTVQPASGASRAYAFSVVAGQSASVSTDAPPTYVAVAPPPPQPPPPPAAPSPPADKTPAKPSNRIRPGPYFLVNATMLWQTSRPYDFEHTSFPSPGFSVGGRAGYRASGIAGIEVLLEYGRISNSGIVLQQYDIDQNGDGQISGGEGTLDRSPGAYVLESLRLGPVLRLTTEGRENRFVGGIGLGALHETIALDHADLLWDSATSQYRSNGTFHHHYEGWSPYLLFEGGYERSIEHFLAGLLVQITFESVSGIGEQPYNSSLQARLGLTLRAGYSLW